MLSDAQRDRLQAWVLTVAPRAVAFARALVSDPSQAEEVVQECLYRLLRRADQYDLERDGVKLLFKAVSNLCINQTTRRKAILSLDSASDDGPIPVPDRNAPPPEEALQHRELESQVRAALQTLPPMQRAAVELRALGMSKDQIGEVLEVTPTHAGVLVHRGRHALAAELRAATGEEFL